jgi:hypothetical protein
MRRIWQTARTALVVTALGGFTANAQVAPSGPPPDGPPETSELRSGANSFTESQARDRLERSGYSDVTSLRKDGQGIWRGEARYGSQAVTVGLDYRGAILREAKP